jgi:hypothetical protein
MDYGAIDTQIKYLQVVVATVPGAPAAVRVWN